MHQETSLIFEFCGEQKFNLRNLMYHHSRDHGIDTKIDRKRKNITVEETSSAKKAKSDSSNDSAAEEILCDTCGVMYQGKNWLNHLRSLEHKKCMLKSFEGDSNIQIVECAFKSSIISYRISDEPNEHAELTEFCDAVQKIKITIGNTNRTAQCD